VCGSLQIRVSPQADRVSLAGLKSSCVGPLIPIKVCLFVCSVATLLGTSVEQGSVGRMVSSGMLGRVALVRADVSEERSASFIRVTRIGSYKSHTA
jgi:hypothetical protein